MSAHTHDIREALRSYRDMMNAPFSPALACEQEYQPAAKPQLHSGLCAMQTNANDSSSRVKSPSWFLTVLKGEKHRGQSWRVLELQENPNTHTHLACCFSSFNTRICIQHMCTTRANPCEWPCVTGGAYLAC